MLCFEYGIEHTGFTVFWTKYTVLRLEASLLTTVYEAHLSCLPKGEFQIEIELIYVKFLLQAGAFQSTFTIMNRYIDRIV